VTKLDLAEYYAEIGEALVPHLRDRPFTLKRYPYGINGSPYFAKQAPKGKPLGPDAAVPYLAARGRLAAGRLRARERAGRRGLDGADELHRHERVVLARRQARSRPDYVVFDLDPPESRNGFSQAIKVAHLVREALEQARAALVREDERADGIHVLVPITRRLHVSGGVRARRAVSRAPRRRRTPVS
jgi:bifunctional non-homologous end joining protein LigD